jgi:hypothetical protein
VHKAKGRYDGPSEQPVRVPNRMDSCVAVVSE